MSERENNKHYRARKGLIDDCMDAIRSCKEWGRLQTVVYYEVGRLGGRMRAQKEGLFDGELWATKENRDRILEVVEAFLWKIVK